MIDMCDPGAQTNRTDGALFVEDLGDRFFVYPVSVFEEVVTRASVKSFSALSGLLYVTGLAVPMPTRRPILVSREFLGL
jgi:hypothetical protein